MDTSEKGQHKLLYEGLNQHGFLFQERCAQILEQEWKTTGWRLEAKEYPVSSSVKNTRIDIVLKDATLVNRDSPTIYAIVECKRVNPSYTRAWLFGKPSSPTQQVSHVMHMFEDTHVDPFTGLAEPTISYSQKKVALDVVAPLISNWWLEISSENNKTKATPQPVEDALTQVCVGLSGLALEQEVQHGKHLGDEQRNHLRAYFLPIIITNAPLYYTEYKLADVDLASGTIPEDKVLFGTPSPEPLPRVMVGYGVSRNITPENFYEGVLGTSPKELQEYHTRTVFIVSSATLVNFFAKLHPEKLK